MITLLSVVASPGGHAPRICTAQSRPAFVPQSHYFIIVSRPISSLSSASTSLHIPNKKISVKNIDSNYYHCEKEISSISTTMAHKRKRSADVSPASICSFGTPEAQSPTSIPHHCGSSMGMDASNQRGSTCWDFSSAGRVKSSGGDWGR